MALLVSVIWHLAQTPSFTTTLPISKGVISWDDPTTPDIKTFASRLAFSMLKMTRFILNPSATFRQTTIQGVDVGLWEINPTEVLVLATNTNYSPVSIPITYFGLSFNGISLDSEQVLDTGIEIDSDWANILFESMGSGAFIIKPNWRYFTTVFHKTPGSWSFDFFRFHCYDVKGRCSSDMITDIGSVCLLNSVAIDCMLILSQNKTRVKAWN